MISDSPNKDQNEVHGSILEQTQILNFVAHIFSLQDETAVDEDGDNLIRYMQLETVWILINISYQEDGVLSIIFEKYPGIFESINAALGSEDLVLVDQLIEFISNSAGESKK